mmetsp:Transcript_52688/g.163486  ORF Transcript_52688/g.163486 Transcript_52688/m.163486 type:complete len:91 (-) Transcript_52688:147-419(-)
MRVAHVVLQQSESAPASSDRSWLSEMGDCAKPLVQKAEEESSDSESSKDPKESTSSQEAALNPNLLSASEWAFLATCASPKASATAASQN